MSRPNKAAAEVIGTKPGKGAEVIPSVTEKIHNLRDVYSTALGGYRNWTNQVDLGPPKRYRTDRQVSDNCISI